MTPTEILTAGLGFALQHGDLRHADFAIRQVIFDVFSKAAPSLTDEERRDYRERLEKWRETTLEKLRERFAILPTLLSPQSSDGA